MAKHYIRLDGTTIIKGFSDAFETPEETDILINEDGGRHFEIEIDSEILTNPSLIDDSGKYKYKYESDTVSEKTESEKWELQEKKDGQISLTKSEASNLLSPTDWKVIRHRDQIDTESGSGTSLTNEEYLTLLDDRQIIRNKSNTIESEIDALTTIQEVDDYEIDFT